MTFFANGVTTAIMRKMSYDKEGNMTGKTTGNKYRAAKATIGDITFDSLFEAQRWLELKMLEKAGAIQDLRRQVRFEIIPKTGRNRAHHYTADFAYTENGKAVVEDVKGVRTRDYLLRRDLLLALPFFAHMVFREYTRNGAKDY